MNKLLSVTIFVLLASENVTPKTMFELSEDRPKIRAKRLIDANRIDIREAPWHVGIMSPWLENLIGSGSIITKHWVITSIHCICRLNGTARSDAHYVVSGYKDYDEAVNRENAEHYVHGIQKIICGNDPTVTVHDVSQKYLGLIKIAYQFYFSDTVKPVSISLGSREKIVGLKGFVSGWGASDEVENYYDFILNGAETEIESAEKCEEHARKLLFKGSLRRSEWCSKVGHRATNCMLDAGNPLVIKNHLVGVHESSIRKDTTKCDPNNQVDIYIAVRYVISWIEEQISPARKYKTHFTVNNVTMNGYLFETVEPPSAKRINNIGGRLLWRPDNIISNTKLPHQ